MPSERVFKKSTRQTCVWQAAIALVALAVACGDDDNGGGPGGADLTLYLADTAVVRGLLDLNSLWSVGVTTVTDSSGGRVTSLNLRNMGISRLSNAIGELDALTTLLLSSNYLSALPDSIVNLRSLTTLTVGRNRLCSLPTRIRAWIDLYVTVSGWDTTQDCTRFKEDTAVVRVILDTNGLGSVSAMAVCDTLLDHVTSLRLAHRALTVLPDTVGALGWLARLDLHDNLLEDLPPTLTGLDSLREVMLDDNRLCSLGTAMAAWADTMSPGWRAYQNCSTSVAPPHVTVLFSDSYGPVPDSVTEHDPRWLAIETAADSLVIDSVSLAADSLSPPLVARFRPVGVPAYYGPSDTFCVLRTKGVNYAGAGGSPAIALGRDALAYLLDFDLQPCIECSTLVTVPGLVIGQPLRLRAVFHFRRLYPDTTIAGRDTLAVRGTVDGVSVGELGVLGSQLMEFSDAVAESLDFSSMPTDTCKSYLDHRQDTASDFVFRNDSLRAARGLKLVRVGSALTDVYPCDSIGTLRDRLDTLSCATQQAGYVPAARLAYGGTYLLWTREGERVLLWNLANYLGGIPRYQFLWARYRGP